MIGSYFPQDGFVAGGHHEDPWKGARDKPGAYIFASAIHPSTFLKPSTQNFKLFFTFSGGFSLRSPLVASRSFRAFHLISRLSNAVTAEPMRIAPP
jgi:hypothetical protein